MKKNKKSKFVDEYGHDYRIPLIISIIALIVSIIKPILAGMI